MARLFRYFIILITACFVSVGVQAQQKQKPPQVASEQIHLADEIRQIKNSLNDINKRLSVDQKVEAERDALGNLKIEIGNSKQAFYDSQVNWLNVFIGFFTLILAVFSIIIAFVGYFGFRSFKEFKTDINARIQKEVKEQYETTVRNIYSKEFEEFREKINADINEIRSQMDNSKIVERTGVPIMIDDAQQNTTSGNAFE